MTAIVPLCNARPGARFPFGETGYGHAAPSCALVPSLAGESMQFHARLATVLRHAAHSEPGARTQYRQLLALLGSMPAGAASELAEAAYDRLDELAATLPQAVQSAILRAPGLRLRNRALVAWLARGEPQAAAAAMATARLTESDWLYLVP